MESLDASAARGRGYSRADLVCSQHLQASWPAKGRADSLIFPATMVQAITCSRTTYTIWMSTSITVTASDCSVDVAIATQQHLVGLPSLQCRVSAQASTLGVALQCSVTTCKQDHVTLAWLQ
jgi:hypothetical protein